MEYIVEIIPIDHRDDGAVVARDTRVIRYLRNEQEAKELVEYLVTKEK